MATAHRQRYCLFVGDLNPAVTESMLYQIFSRAGRLVSIRVCRDRIHRTGRSLGYAYVNFQRPSDAERALDILNFEEVMGQEMRIMWCQRDPSLRKSGVGNVFVKNLDKTIDNKALHDAFSAFGNILSCKVASDENGPKGYGFVHFETLEAAERAIQKVNGVTFNNRTLYANMFMPQQERKELIGDTSTKFTNVFVKNFADLWDDTTLEETFAEFGDILSAKVMKDDEGTSLGFGFVRFEMAESAENAVETMNGKEIEGRAIYVGRAKKMADRKAELKKEHDKKHRGRNLYVKNLEYEIDNERLQQEFSSYGTITSAKVMRDEKGRSRGFGFVCFSSMDEAKNAMAKMNGQVIVSKPLQVRMAEKKEERADHLYTDHIARIAQQAQAPLMAKTNFNFPFIPQPQSFYMDNPFFNQNRPYSYFPNRWSQPTPLDTLNSRAIPPQIQRNRQLLPPRFLRNSQNGALSIGKM